MRFVTLFSAPVLFASTQADNKPVSDLTAIGEVDNPAEPAKAVAGMDYPTWLLALATVLCTGHETLQATGDLEIDWINRRTQFCILKSVANIGNSVRRLRNPNVGSKALEELFKMEAAQLGLPMLARVAKHAVDGGSLWSILGLGTQAAKIGVNTWAMLAEALLRLYGLGARQ